MSDAWATIIAALIGVISTVFVTKFEDILMWFKRPLNIAGIWDGETYELTYGSEIITEPPVIQHTPTLRSKYIVTLKQRGEKFEAEMVETEVFEEGLKKSKYTWKGKIVKDYAIYESTCDNAETFLRSSAMLYIHARGQKMTGYFVATSGEKAPLRTWVGFVILNRKI